MICPNCNTELQKGHLYCDKCGTEIQMVPIFEPELEESIHETLSGVADVIVEESDSTQDSKRHDRKHKKRPNKRMMFYSLLGLFVMFAIVFVCVKVNRYCSFDYQYQKAQECFAVREYDAATDFVKRAIEIDATKAEAQILLSDLYLKYEKYDEALAILLQLMAETPNDIALYERVVAIYVHKEDYAAINQLMAACDDVQITSQFSQYVSMPPEFSLEEGTYDKKEMLKLMSGSEGSIYYTVDGSEPTVDSEQYTTAISLEEGINVIRAIFVNQSGIVSEAVSHTYQIELAIPLEPAVSPESGTYTSPEPIVATMMAEDGGIICYTDDGTEPNEESKEYLTSIPMPLGSSHFRFVVFSRDGVRSHETEVKYNLNIVSLIDTATAENAVIMTLFGKGELLDITGTYKDGKTKYRYQCNAAAKAGTRIYYLVEEFQVTEDETVSTGRYFGVDVRTGELYHVSVNQETGAFEFSLFSLFFN